MTLSVQDGDQTKGSHSLHSKFRELLTEYIPVFATLGVRAVAVLAGFTVTYLLGRYFGPEANGQYALVTQTAIALAVAGMVGLDQSVVRHFSKAVAEKKHLALSLVLRVLTLALALTTVWIFALNLGREKVWSILFGNAVGIGALTVFCVLLFARTGGQILAAMLRSQHRFALGMAVNTLFVPASAAFALLTGLANNVTETLWAAAIGSLVALLLALMGVAPHIKGGQSVISIPMKSIFASSFPLWGVGLSLVVVDWYGLAVAARMLSVADAGLYRVSVQIAGIVLLVSSTIFSVYGAKISAAFHGGGAAEAARIAKFAIWISAGMALPFSLLILLFGEFILAQIGPEFLPAMPVLAVFAIGQFLIGLAGPAGLVLAMSGNEKTTLIVSMGGTLATLIIAPLGAWLGGLVGLAACISVVQIMRGAICYVIVRRKLGMDLWTGTVRPVKGSAE